MLGWSPRSGNSYDPSVLERKPGEEYMSPAQVEHFTKILTAWRLQPY
ncbi:DnaK suppressor protein [Vibrio parahaemolyticus AQ3810]|nr:DnaK suppressor protein [Vibrio parahaemolyticus AQ3810]